MVERIKAGSIDTVQWEAMNPLVFCESLDIVLCCRRVGSSGINMAESKSIACHRGTARTSADADNED